jgi:hypothetical protein
MPLMSGKSDKAFKHNVKTEYEAGKPVNQSLAIAYNMKKKSKKMASGGQITDNYESSCTSDCNHPCTIHEKAQYDPKEEPMRKSNSMAMMEDDRDLNQHGEIEEGRQGHEDMMAEGGNVGPIEEQNTDNYSDTEDGDGQDMVGRIMKQRQQEFSKGGRVANEMSSNRGTDYLATDDDLEFNYTGANSGDELSSDREDDDRRDIVSRVMKSRRMRASMDGMSGYGRSDKALK